MATAAHDDVILVPRDARRRIGLDVHVDLNGAVDRDTQVPIATVERQLRRGCGDKSNNWLDNKQD